MLDTLAEMEELMAENWYTQLLQTDNFKFVKLNLKDLIIYFLGFL